MDELVKSKEARKDEVLSIQNASRINYIISSCPALQDRTRIHRVVLTGGPCAGKSTCLNRIKTFFQNIGWKVFCVPETATILLSTGINFYDLKDDYKIKFQENLLKNLLQIEESVYQAAKFYQYDKKQNCIVIYDRGAMDPVSYLEPDEWELLKRRNPNWNEVNLRDTRYDQIIHLITAAKGAEDFYTLSNNSVRTESIETARVIDEKCAKSWIGHPCMDIVDNCFDFEAKVAKALQLVCERIGLNLKGFGVGNKKRKFLVKSIHYDHPMFPNFTELKVIHNFLVSSPEFGQIRLRKSGDGDNWSYSYSILASKEGQYVETHNQVKTREYAILSKAIDENHVAVVLKRQCFIWKNRYYRLDIYQEPSEGALEGLILLSTRIDDEELILPDFFEIEKEVTEDPKYFTYNLSLKNNFN